MIFESFYCLLEVMTPEEYDGRTGYGLYVFDTVVPVDMTLPTDGTVWMVNVAGSVEGAGYTVQGEVALNKAELLSPSTSSSTATQALMEGLEAKNIYIIGVRSSAMLANFLSYSLQMVFDNVRLIDTTAGSELFQQMMAIGEGDVLFAISFPRYSKRVIKAVEFARRAGADVVALTDSPEAPIAPSAQQVLIAQSDMASYVDSLVAPLSLLNAIIVAVSRTNEEAVRERLQKLEHIWDEYDVYDKNQG